MSSICIIPARGGSVRLPGKNIRKLGGTPVIAYSIRLAQQAGVFDEILVSTDDQEIGFIAKLYGADVWRRDPDDGTKGTQEVAAEILDRIPRAHIACVIYPIAPLLDRSLIIQAYAQLAIGPKKFCMGCREDPLSDAGAFYAGWAQAFRDRLPLVRNAHLALLPEERVCDVNDEADWVELEDKFNALKAAR